MLAGPSDGREGLPGWKKAVGIVYAVGSGCQSVGEPLERTAEKGRSLMRFLLCECFFFFEIMGTSSVLATPPRIHRLSISQHR